MTTNEIEKQLIKKKNKLILKHKESGFVPRLVKSSDYKLSQNIMRNIMELESEEISTQKREDVLIKEISNLWISLHELYSNEAKVTHDEVEGLDYHIVEWSENYLTFNQLSSLKPN